jgi:predicted transcriptional regulator
VLPAKGGGFWIRAYSNPQYFLERRGLIEKQERDVPGTWYRLTETGRAAIEKAAR